MLKILHILPMNKLSGAEKMALLICKNSNTEKLIVVTGGENLSSYFIELGITTYSVNFSFKNLVVIIKQLRNIIKKNNVNIIHAHDNKASIFGYLVTFFCKEEIKIISHIHSCYPWLKKNGLNKLIDRVARPKYDMNIICGNNVIDYYLKFAPYIESNKMKILSNVVDSRELKMINISNGEDIKREHKIPTDKIIIGFVGRFTEAKGLIPFIKGLPLYKHQLKNCIFLLVGEGELEQEMKNLIHNLELDDLFIFTGYRKETNIFYSIMDLFILPSIFEGLPMVILEAMVFDIPIVSMDVGSISEVVINEETGYLINNNRIDLFIEKIIFLINNKSKCNEFSIKVSQIVENKSIDNYIKSLNEIYYL